MDRPELAPTTPPIPPPNAVVGALFLLAMFVLAIGIAFGGAGVLTNWAKSLPPPPAYSPL